MQDCAIVYNIDIYEGIKKLSSQNKRFDIVFLDPPYALEGITQILKDIISYNLLEEDGYIVLECSSKMQLEMFTLLYKCY